MRVSPWNRHAPATKWRQDGGTVSQRKRRTPATKWRQVVAMGVSPSIRNPPHPVSPEGTTGIETQPFPAAPSRLRARLGLGNHGFAPVATTCRPFGTNGLTRGRYVGAEEVEDDGVPCAEKLEGLTILYGDGQMRFAGYQSFHDRLKVRQSYFHNGLLGS